MNILINNRDKIIFNKKIEIYREEYDDNMVSKLLSHDIFKGKYLYGKCFTQFCDGTFKIRKRRSFGIGSTAHLKLINCKFP